MIPAVRNFPIALPLFTLYVNKNHPKTYCFYILPIIQCTVSFFNLFYSFVPQLRPFFSSLLRKSALPETSASERTLGKDPINVYAFFSLNCCTRSLKESDSAESSSLVADDSPRSLHCSVQLQKSGLHRLLPVSSALPVSQITAPAGWTFLPLR